ncbi:MAG: discoidin domain-containing protein [Bacteroidota bacterium]|nr:discoidin domain-containing protein [Bacteroidota bacterium]
MRSLLIVLAVLAGLNIETFAQNNRMSLNSDNKSVQWKVIAQADVKKAAAEIFPSGINTSGWVSAIVPGTVFNSYVVAGLEKDPNFGDNIYKVDKKKYDRNFWYRTEFNLPVNYTAEKTWLNFEGINRKGDVYFNGEFLGKLDGFMERGKYDISNLLVKDKPNVLAVLVYWPQTPIPNYASPTYISSSSWDWMPYVPGLLMGITDDVYLTSSGAVTINDSWIRTEVPSKSKAEVSLNIELNNSSDVEQEGELSGVINPGNISFSQKVKIGAHQNQTVFFDQKKVKELEINNPELWWPNGYGEAKLYTAELKFNKSNELSDTKKITFGIKKYTYDTIGNVLHIKVNGEPVFVKGGNWGMSEYMLRCRGAEYDLKVKLHKEMNFNMIRNWIGSTTDEEFYEACDKYGIMVWDDFWLNSHPNLPSDVNAFNKNAVEKIKRLRNHPCIAVWCGDNEGYPLPPLNTWLKEDVKVFDANDRLYQANSHSDALTGSGPWANFHPIWYFTRSPNGFGGDKGWGFRTEIGTAVFVSFESFKKFMPKETWWPRNEMWDKHFFGPSAGNGGPDTYDRTINKSYGQAKGIEDYCRKAQLVNIETNKALYEGWLHNMWNDASGVMTWMSQSAYPSMVWQTYDYYYDLNGAYWGVKKACEPIHIQWSYADNSVKVVNTSLNTVNDLKAEAVVYNLNGLVQKNLGKTAIVNSSSNTARPCFTLDLDLNTDNMAFKKRAVASSVSTDASDAAAVSDGNNGSRWSSNYTDDEWVYVDLGESKTVKSVVLNWEAAYAKAYKLQVSDDAVNWSDIYTTDQSKGGYEHLLVTPAKGRYVRMLGVKRATGYGYSLYDFEVYADTKPVAPQMQFIRLYLKNSKNELVSYNFYWRSSKNADYTALNSLPKVNLKITSKLTRKDGRIIISATITNTSSAPAFAIKVQVVRASDGERILPATMNDDYFTLMKGESKSVQIDFDEALLMDGKYKLIVEPYNNF